MGFLFSNAIAIRLIDIFSPRDRGAENIGQLAGWSDQITGAMGKILEAVKVVEVAQYVFVPRP
jgi:hypothetical protein